jgi:hypothetical protein
MVDEETLLRAMSTAGTNHAAALDVLSRRLRGRYHTDQLA